MSFLINGVAWQPKTAREYALNMLAMINAGRQARGEEILSASPDNAIWIMLLAAGSEKEAVDQALAIAISDGLNPSLCDDTQISNLLPIAGTSRIPASYTTAVLTVVAKADGAVNLVGGSSKLKYTYSGKDVYFVVDSNVTISAGVTASVPVTCDTAGAIELPSGALTEFESTVANLSSVTNAAGVTGRDLETIAQVRNRIILGNTIESGLDGAMLAIKALDGVTECKIWFNVSRSANLTLVGGQVVPPRNAYMVIAGSSSLIAKTFLEKLLVSTVGATTQNWTTAAGQTIGVKYDAAASQNAYIKIFYDSTETYDSGLEEMVKATILAHQADMKIGEVLTSQEICAWFAGFPYGTIVSAQVSLNGSSWSEIKYFNANAIPLFAAARITVAAYA
jgi:hypothetical protein